MASAQGLGLAADAFVTALEAISGPSAAPGELDSPRLLLGIIRESHGRGHQRTLHLLMKLVSHVFDCIDVSEGSSGPALDAIRSSSPQTSISRPGAPERLYIAVHETAKAIVQSLFIPCSLPFPSVALPVLALSS